MEGGSPRARYIREKDAEYDDRGGVVGAKSGSTSILLENGAFRVQNPHYPDGSEMVDEDATMTAAELNSK